MKRVLAAAITLAAARSFAADAQGCKDHPLFPRVPGYELQHCERDEFDARTFPNGPELSDDQHATDMVNVEGAQTTLQYCARSEGKHETGQQIAHHFEAAVKAAGGRIVAQFGSEEEESSLGDDVYGATDHAVAAALEKSGKETRALVLPYSGGACYALYVGEKHEARAPAPMR